jgi:hypothetical protein
MNITTSPHQLLDLKFPLSVIYTSEDLVAPVIGVGNTDQQFAIAATINILVMMIALTIVCVTSLDAWDDIRRSPFLSMLGIGCLRFGSAFCGCCACWPRFIRKQGRLIQTNLYGLARSGEGALPDEADGDGDTISIPLNVMGDDIGVDTNPLLGDVSDEDATDEHDNNVVVAPPKKEIIMMTRNEKID